MSNHGEHQSIPLHHLRKAVQLGVITDEQLEQVRRLSEQASEPAEGPEAARGLNAVTVAYWAGALVVLFALGWFLADRWKALGAFGVLNVSGGYALLFAVVGRWLHRERFPLAASIAALLVVGMVPIMTWSVMSLAGWWPEPAGPGVPAVYGLRVSEFTRWIPVDLATIVAALVAIRLVRFGILALPAAAAFWYLCLHVTAWIVGVPTIRNMEEWAALVAGTTLLAGAYAVERRQTADDYAQWLYLVGVAAVAFFFMIRWERPEELVPHVALATSALSIAVALRLRRRPFVVAGTMGFVGYLAWLAFDVFRNVVSFPIVLAAFGLSIIMLAVWIQRRFPGLVRRTRAVAGAPRPTIPGGQIAFTAPVLLAVVLFALAIPAARRRAAMTPVSPAGVRIQADTVRPDSGTIPPPPDSQVVRRGRR